MTTTIRATRKQTELNKIAEWKRDSTIYWGIIRLSRSQPFEESRRTEQIATRYRDVYVRHYTDMDILLFKDILSDDSGLRAFVYLFERTEDNRPIYYEIPSFLLAFLPAWCVELS